MIILLLPLLSTLAVAREAELAVGDRAHCMDVFTRVVGLSHDEAVEKCGPDPNAATTTKKPAINDCCTVGRSTNDPSCRAKGNDQGCNRKLKLGEGDCDSHCDCEGHFTMCGNNNCPWGDGDDCCRSMTNHEVKFIIKDCPSYTESELGLAELAVGDRAECMRLFTGVVGLSHDEAVEKCGPDPNAPKPTEKPAAINDCCTVDRSTNDPSCKVKGNDQGCGRKLKLGEGDCDSHCDCEGHFTMCGSNNCPWGDGDDCCRSMTNHEVKFVIKDCPSGETVFLANETTFSMNDVVVYVFAAAGLGFLLYGAVKHFSSQKVAYDTMEV